MTTTPVIFVTVGASHYPFDRLFTWIERWLATPRGATVRCVAQHGTSRPPSGAECVPYLPYDGVIEAIDKAAAVVCHAGTGSVVQVREHGTRPIVVPRVHAHREVVDDHQVSFARRLRADGQVELAESESELVALLDAVADGRLSLAIEPEDPSELPSIRRFEALMADLLSGKGAR